MAGSYVFTLRILCPSAAQRLEGFLHFQMTDIKVFSNRGEHEMQRFRRVRIIIPNSIIRQSFNRDLNIL